MMMNDECFFGRAGFSFEPPHLSPSPWPRWRSAPESGRSCGPGRPACAARGCGRSRRRGLYERGTGGGGGGNCVDFFFVVPPLASLSVLAALHASWGGTGPPEWAACRAPKKAPRKKKRGDGRRRPPPPPRSLSLVGVQYLLHRHQGGRPRPHGLGLGHGVHAGRGGRGKRGVEKKSEECGRSKKKHRHTSLSLCFSPRAPQRLVACVGAAQRAEPSPTLPKHPPRGLFSLPSAPASPPHAHAWRARRRLHHAVRQVRESGEG